MDGEPRRHSRQASRGGEPRVHSTATLRNARLGRFTEVGERVAFRDSTLGDYSYIERHSEAIYTIIGKFCAIAADVRLNALRHPIERVSQHKITYRPNEYFLGRRLDSVFRAERRGQVVEIGHDVWIGHGAIVLPGVRIGNGAVVGAGAVVTRDVQDHAVMAGVPARRLRWRFPPELQRRIAALAWWDWDHDRLALAVDDMRALSAEEFVRRYEG